MRAVLNDVVIAESDDTVVVEGNQYFPPDAVNWELLVDSAHTSVCPWKGSARYWSVQAGGRRADDAAWSYPPPKPAASEIAGHVEFLRGVRVPA
jgi:uncharacterized protein (DUF427 family)